MTVHEATQITGGLSAPSKMPGFAYSIPAQRCVTGSKLVNVKGSVCEGCYALKGRYVFSNVRDAQERRFASLYDPRWCDAMVVLIESKRKAGHTFFRWHDAGDLQSILHLLNIVEVARRTPDVRHWLPTREYAIVRYFLRHQERYGDFPENLTVRVSAHMVNGKAPAMGLPVSTVYTDSPPEGAHACPASTERHRAMSKDGGPSCGDCRACWDTTVEHVSYPMH
jgi:protein gp88